MCTNRAASSPGSLAQSDSLATVRTGKTDALLCIDLSISLFVRATNLVGLCNRRTLEEQKAIS